MGNHCNGSFQLEISGCVISDCQRSQVMNFQEGPFAGGLETFSLKPSITVRSGVPDSLPTTQYWRERIKLHARALMHRRVTDQWLRVLNAHPVFCDLVRDTPK